MSIDVSRPPVSALHSPRVARVAGEECPEFLTGGREQQRVQFCRRPALHTGEHQAKDGTTWPNRSEELGSRE